LLKPVRNDPAYFDVTARLTALWGFSEAFLGGFLHGMKLPFTGLLVGNTAVIIIILIGTLSGKKTSIMRACIVTMIIKALVSPHTPVTAYLAVFLQGFIGQLLFSNGGIKTVSAVALGLIAGILSSLQKVIFLTLVFGQEFWNAVNQFSVFVLQEVFRVKDANVQLSFWLITLYIGIHVTAGILAGFYGSHLSKNIKTDSSDGAMELKEKFFKMTADYTALEELKAGRKKRFWYKPTKILLFIFLFGILFMSYFYTDNGYFTPNPILLMILRSVSITIIWFKFLGPFLLKLFRNRFINNRNKYTDEAQGILGMLPFIKSAVRFSWAVSKGVRGIKRLSIFSVQLLTIILTYEFKPV